MKKPHESIAADPDMAAAIATIADAIEEQEGPLSPKKREVVRAAIILFAEQGFAATSTRQISDLAGVAEATIFRHFPTKQDLLLRVVQPVLANRIVPAAIDQFAQAVVAHPGDPREIIVPVLLERMGFLRRHAPLIKILIYEFPFQPKLKDLLFSQFPLAFDAVAAFLKQEMKAGRLREEDPERVIRLIGSSFIGYFMTSAVLLPDRAWDDKQEISRLVDLIFSGIWIGDDGARDESVNF